MKARQKGKQAFMKEENLELELARAQGRVEKYANTHEGEWLVWLNQTIDEATPIPEDLFKRMEEILKRAEENKQND